MDEEAHSSHSPELGERMAKEAPRLLQQEYGGLAPSVAVAPSDRRYSDTAIVLADQTFALGKWTIPRILRAGAGQEAWAIQLRWRIFAVKTIARTYPLEDRACNPSGPLVRYNVLPRGDEAGIRKLNKIGRAVGIPKFINYRGRETIEELYPDTLMPGAEFLLRLGVSEREIAKGVWRRENFVRYFERLDLKQEKEIEEI